MKCKPNIYWVSRAFIYLMCPGLSFISCSIGGAEWTVRCQRVAPEKLRENKGTEELGADDQAWNESLMAAWCQWAGPGGVTEYCLENYAFRLTYFNKGVESIFFNAGDKVS